MRSSSEGLGRFVWRCRCTVKRLAEVRATLTLIRMPSTHIRPELSDETSQVLHADVPVSVAYRRQPPQAAVPGRIPLHFRATPFGYFVCPGYGQLCNEQCHSLRLAAEDVADAVEGLLSPISDHERPQRPARRGIHQILLKRRRAISARRDTGNRFYRAVGCSCPSESAAIVRTGRSRQLPWRPSAVGRSVDCQARRRA